MKIDVGRFTAEESAELLNVLPSELLIETLSAVLTMEQIDELTERLLNTKPRPVPTDHINPARSSRKRSYRSARIPRCYRPKLNAQMQPYSHPRQTCYGNCSDS